MAVLLPALRLLALGDAPVELAKRASRKVPNFADPGQTFAAFQLLRAANTPAGALATLERCLAEMESPSDRMAFLVQMGELIEERNLRG